MSNPTKWPLCVTVTVCDCFIRISPTPQLLAENGQGWASLTHSVVAPGVVVGRILLPGHQLLRVEQLTVGSSPNLVHH